MPDFVTAHAVGPHIDDAHAIHAFVCNPKVLRDWTCSETIAASAQRAGLGSETVVSIKVLARRHLAGEHPVHAYYRLLPESTAISWELGQSSSWRVMPMDALLATASSNAESLEGFSVFELALVTLFAIDLLLAMCETEPDDSFDPEELQRLPKTRAEARKQRSTWYFPGRRCGRSHLSPKNTTSGSCVQCIKVRSRASYHVAKAKRQTASFQRPAVADNVVPFPGLKY